MRFLIHLHVITQIKMQEQTSCQCAVWRYMQTWLCVCVWLQERMHSLIWKLEYVSCWHGSSRAYFCHSSIVVCIYMYHTSSILFSLFTVIQASNNYTHIHVHIYIYLKMPFINLIWSQSFPLTPAQWFLAVMPLKRNSITRKRIKIHINCVSAKVTYMYYD